MKRSALKMTAIVIGSGVSGIILFILAVTAYVYISAYGNIPEIYTQFYENEYQENFATAMKEAGIPYRVENNKIWYSEENQERVNKIRPKVLSTMPVMYEFSDMKLLENFLSFLNKESAKYSVNEMGMGKSVILDKEYSVVAREAYKKVMSGE